MENINIDNELDLIISDMIEENRDMQTENKNKEKESFQEEKRLFNEWIWKSFNKEDTWKYVVQLLTNPKYWNIQSFYKNIRKNVKDNIKMLWFILEEKGLSDFKSELWNQLSETTIIGIKKWKENEVIKFLLNDQTIKDFIKNNKIYNQKELLKINLEVPEFYKKISELIINKQLSNSFYSKENWEVEKMLEKVWIDYNEFELSLEYKWWAIYLSFLRQIHIIGENFKKINWIAQFFIDYKVLSTKDKDNIEQLKDILTKDLKKIEELKKFMEHEYYHKWLFLETDFGRWYKGSDYTSIPEISKSFSTKIWNIFKSLMSDLPEIKKFVSWVNFKNNLWNIEDYIFTNNGVYQNFLDLTNYKTIVKQMIVSWYFHNWQKIVEEDNLKEIVNNLLIDNYKIADEYSNMIAKLEFITDNNYGFIKEYNSQDELLPQRLIKKADSLIKVNGLIKEIDNYVIKYIKEFFLEYIKEEDHEDLYDTAWANNILWEKSMIPKWLQADLDEHFEELKKSIKNVEKNVYTNKLNKKYVYTITLTTGVIKFTINFKKDILLEYKKDISTDDILLAKENLLYYIKKNFPEMIENIKDNSLFISNFSKTKLTSGYFYKQNYDLERIKNLDKNKLDKIINFYENLSWINIENIKRVINGKNNINDYIIMSLIVNDLIYIYKKKII